MLDSANTPLATTAAELALLRRPSLYHNLSRREMMGFREKSFDVFAYEFYSAFKGFMALDTTFGDPVTKA